MFSPKDSGSRDATMVVLEVGFQLTGLLAAKNWEAEGSWSLLLFGALIDLTIENKEGEGFQGILIHITPLIIFMQGTDAVQFCCFTPKFKILISKPRCKER